MPTYAYQCKDCHHAFDIVQSFAEDSLTTCDQCSGRLRKKFGNVGVSFKGSGFYRNDSRSGSQNGSSSSEKSSSAASRSGGSDTSSASPAPSSPSTSSKSTSTTSGSGSSTS